MAYFKTHAYGQEILLELDKKAPHKIDQNKKQSIRSTFTLVPSFIKL